MNGAEFIVDSLKSHGVDRIFMLCGNGLNDLMHACMDGNVRLIDARNEQVAAYMADTWGAMTAMLGVAMVSSGPGHTNALTGLTNAWWDGRPMLLISGCSNAETRGMGHFQQLDQVGLASHICKYSRLVERPDQLTAEIEKAVTIALSGRPGPVHLTVTADVLSAEMEASNDRPTGAVLREVTPRCLPTRDAIDECAQQISDASQPVIIAGNGCFYSQAGPALRKFADKLNIPVFTPIWGRGCVEDRWPQYMGPTTCECNGAFDLVSEADVILVLGGRLDYRLGYGMAPVCASDARFIRVNVEPVTDGHHVNQMTHTADPCSFVAAVDEAMDGTETFDNWLEELRAAREKFIDRWDGELTSQQTPLPALEVIRTIKPFLQRDVTFLLDGGNIGRWAHAMLWDRHPAHWQTCGASGVVGWGIGGAIAAKMSRPEHPLLLLSGDGAAGFNIADIETALRHETPYVAVVASDAAWGIVAEQYSEDRRDGSALGDIRFDRAAEALGARGVYIEHGSQLEPQIDQGLKLNTVTIIHVPIQLGGIDHWDEKLLRQDE